MGDGGELGDGLAGLLEGGFVGFMGHEDDLGVLVVVCEARAAGGHVFLLNDRRQADLELAQDAGDGGDHTRAVGRHQAQVIAGVHVAQRSNRARLEGDGGSAAAAFAR